MKNTNLILIGLFSIVSAQANETVSMSQVDTEVAAIPFVQAWPSYTDFGSVKAPSTRSTAITFSNRGSTDIRFFNAYCVGDMSVYNCSSSCFSLPPFGSCTVWVTFMPRSGDGLRKWVTVQGHGDGAFASADVYGTDQK